MGPVKSAVIAALVWIALVFGVFFLHVEVALSGKLSKEHDEAMSETYGQLAGLGTFPVGFITYWLVKKRSEE